MDFITEFIEGASSVVSSFSSILSSAVQGIANVFYTPGADGGLTIVGGAMAFALAVGVVYLLFRMIRGLVKQNNRG